MKNANQESRLVLTILIIAAFVMAYLIVSAARASFVLCDDFEYPGVVICVDGRTGKIQP